MLNEHSIRKYAANSKHVDHVEWRQRFYLLLLYKNKAVCLGVSEFAAYFRQALSEVRGKTEIVRPDPSFRLPRPALIIVLGGSGHCGARRQRAISASQRYPDAESRGDDPLTC